MLAYSAAEGVFLGAITGVFKFFVPGVALQAILGTALVFVTMLVVYKTGAVKVTPRLTKWVAHWDSRTWVSGSQRVMWLTSVAWWN